MLQPPRRPPPPPTCPGPLRSSPRPALPVTESSRHGVCLRACELPKLIVMVLSRAQRPGCFLASAVGLHKRQGRRKWVLLGSSGSDERQLLFVGEQLTASPPPPVSSPVQGCCLSPGLPACCAHKGLQEPVPQQTAGGWVGEGGGSFLEPVQGSSLRAGVFGEEGSSRVWRERRVRGDDQPHWSILITVKRVVRAS